MDNPLPASQQQAAGATESAGLSELELRLIRAEVVDLGITVQFTYRTVTLIISSIIFLYIVLQESAIQNSVHYVAIISLMAGVYIVFNALYEYLSALAPSIFGLQAQLAEVALRLMYLIMAFVSGLFVRLVSDPIVNGPHIGGFGFGDLMWPAVVVALIICVVTYVQLITGQNKLLVAALMREFQQLHGRGVGHPVEEV